MAAHLAYRSCGRIHEWDFSAKRSLEGEILVGVDLSLADFAAAIEGSEKRKDARTCREFVLALPAEATSAQRLEIAKRYAEWLRSEFGCAVHVVCHRPDGWKKGEHRAVDTQRNFHAHLTATDRAWSDNQPGEKIRKWNAPGWVDGVAHRKYEEISEAVMGEPLPDRGDGKRRPIAAYKAEARQTYHETQIKNGRLPSDTPIEHRIYARELRTVASARRGIAAGKRRTAARARRLAARRRFHPIATRFGRGQPRHESRIDNINRAAKDRRIESDAFDQQHRGRELQLEAGERQPEIQRTGRDDQQIKNRPSSEKRADSKRGTPDPIGKYEQEQVRVDDFLTAKRRLEKAESKREKMSAEMRAYSERKPEPLVKKHPNRPIRSMLDLFGSRYKKALASWERECSEIDRYNTGGNLTDPAYIKQLKDFHAVYKRPTYTREDFDRVQHEIDEAKRALDAAPPPKPKARNFKNPKKEIGQENWPKRSRGRRL